MAGPRSSARATWTSASAARNSSAISWKFSMWGPTTTARPASAGSSTLWPPVGTRLPPDEDDGRERIGVRQLAHGVEDEHVAVAPRRDRPACCGGSRGGRRARPGRPPRARAAGWRGATSRRRPGAAAARLRERARAPAPPRRPWCCPRPTAARRRRAEERGHGRRGGAAGAGGVVFDVAGDADAFAAARRSRARAPRGPRPASGTRPPRASTRSSSGRARR